MRDWLILAGLLLIVAVVLYLTGLGFECLKSMILGGGNVAEIVNAPKP